MKKYLLYGGIVLLFIVNLINSSKFENSKSEFSDALKAYHDRHQSDSTLIESLVDNICLTSLNSNFKISPKLKLTSENKTEVLLKDIGIKKYKLVFRFNEFTCKDCIYEEMGNIQEITDEIGEDNILLLGAYNNPRYLFLNKRINNLNFQVYNVPLNSINNTIENINKPYIFIIDKNLNVQNLFIPYKDIPALSQKYFKDILIKFKTNP